MTNDQTEPTEAEIEEYTKLCQELAALILTSVEKLTSLSIYRDQKERIDAEPMALAAIAGAALGTLDAGMVTRRMSMAERAIVAMQVEELRTVFRTRGIEIFEEYQNAPRH